MKIKAVPCFREPEEPWIARCISKGWTVDRLTRLKWERPAYFWSGQYVFPFSDYEQGRIEVVGEVVESII